VSLEQDFLTFIKSHGYWPLFREKLLSHRPEIPPHNPDEDNTESWKSASAQQKGFDLCCSLFQLDKE